MISRHTARVLAVLSVGGVLVGAGLSASADDDKGGKGLRARPFVFVDPTNAACGTQPGADIVTAAWLGGMGLADDGVTPTPPPAGAGRDPHTGLLLNKNGPTPNCSASGATIQGFKPGTTISEIGFDFRNGGHCGAGAPRFNVTSTAGNLYFVGGCSAGTHTPAPQDAEWVRVRFSAADFFGSPSFVFNVTQVRSIEILYDEGTDTPTVSDPNGVGLAVLDNIDINGQLITSGKGIAPKDDGKLHNGRNDADDD